MKFPGMNVVKINQLNLLSNNQLNIFRKPLKFCKILIKMKLKKVQKIKIQKIIMNQIGNLIQMTKINHKFRIKIILNRQLIILNKIFK